MVVDVRHHRHFVCRRGQVLRELAEEYGGVAVSFPRTGANSQRVTLKGAKDCVEAAKKRIQEIIEDLVREIQQGSHENAQQFTPRVCLHVASLEQESQVSVEVAIPQRYHRAIMGPKGCRIQHITREHEVQIKFPERDDSAAGDKQDAAAAPTRPGQNQIICPDLILCAAITGQETPLQENGEVSPEAEFIPRKCDIITISGRAEKCELAKAALLVGISVLRFHDLIGSCQSCSIVCFL